MTEETVNTPEKALTLNEAFARLQEKRTAAKATSSTGKPINEAAPTKEDNSEEEVEVTDQEAEATTEEVVNDGTQTDEVDGEGSDEVKDVYLVTLKNEAGEEVEQEVPADELIKGYLRQADYTRKRTKDVEEHKAKLTEVTSKLSALDEALQGALVQQSAELEQYKALDWDSIRKSDVNEYNRLQLAYRDAQATVSGRYAQLRAVRQYQQEQAEAAHAVYLQEQSSLLKDLMPDWDKQEPVLKEYLHSSGITDLSPFTSAKLILLVSKAKQFDDLQAKKETIVKKKLDRPVPRSLTPGATPSKSEISNEQITALSNNLKKTGSIQDALALKQVRRKLNS